MKNSSTIFLIIFSLISSLAFSSVKLKVSENNAGKNLISGKAVVAKEYKFPGVIQKSYLDTLTNSITVVQQRVNQSGEWLKNRGDLILFSIKDDNIKWSKSINYVNSKVLQYNDNIFLESDNILNCLKISDGDELWDAKVNLKYIDPLMNVGIGYTYRSAIGVTNMLKGVDLKTGEVIWKREISEQYNWSNQIIHINDSVILIVAAGLHTINLKTGKGWDYDMITGENETKIVNNDVYHVSDVYAFTKYSGVFLKNEVISNVGSNLLNEDGYIYFASKDNLIKIDLDGNIQWTFAIPSGKSSSSELFIRYNRLYLFNKGYASYNETSVGPLDPNVYDQSVDTRDGNEKISYGKPYLTAFNPNNGKQLFVKEFNTDDQLILDSKIQDDRLTVLYQDKMKAFSLVDGSVIEEKSFLINVLDPFNHFLNDKIYLKTEDVKGSKIIDPDTYYLISTRDNNLVVIDHNFEFVKNLVLAENYLPYRSNKYGYNIFANNKETIILNPAGKAAALLSVSANQIIAKKVLYEIKDGSFVIVDLKDILTE
ncbi:hypothetical protein ACE01N_07345 [Saccharicrinis sp. FJH2]|uniref:hypothetical protein n=1 Tax=Saccharicrinis sp. FJH65 TaxID=3344659 RepID=UPI0035F430E9